MRLPLSQPWPSLLVRPPQHQRRRPGTAVIIIIMVVLLPLPRPPPPVVMVLLPLPLPLLPAAKNYWSPACRAGDQNGFSLEVPLV
jgi:hypothetical protein